LVLLRAMLGLGHGRAGARVAATMGRKRTPP
jgi:hypothetical protein